MCSANEVRVFFRKGCHGQNIVGFKNIILGHNGAVIKYSKDSAAKLKGQH